MTRPIPATKRGKLCYKHPELNGLRYISNNGCTACQAESLEKRRLTESEHRPKFDDAALKELQQAGFPWPSMEEI